MTALSHAIKTNSGGIRKLSGLRLVQSVSWPVREMSSQWVV